MNELRRVVCDLDVPDTAFGTGPDWAGARIGYSGRTAHQYVVNTISPCEEKAARALAEIVVKVGGVIVAADPLFRTEVVGHIAWLGDRHLFWFEAKGRGPSAAHRLEYDAVCRVFHRGVVFFRSEQIVAYLCTIATAGTCDQVFMRATHQRWTVVESRLQQKVCDCCERLDEFAGARSCIWRLPRCDHTRHGELHSADSIRSSDCGRLEEACRG